MRKKLSVAIFAAVAWGFMLPGGAYADSLSVCMAVASKQNANLPMQVDKYTTALNVNCVSRGNVVVVVYSFKLSFDRRIEQRDLNVMRQSQLSAWCGNPPQRDILRNYVVENLYYDAANQYIGKLRYTENMCS